MNKLKKVVSAFICAALLSSIAAITASAEVYNKGKYEKKAVNYEIKLSKAEIKDAIWEVMSPSNKISSKISPKSSYYYNMLCEWVDEYYGYKISVFNANDCDTVTCDWNDIDDILDDYKEYWQYFEETHRDIFENDIYYLCSYDKNTETFGDERYHFEFSGGKWLQLDDKNNVVDSFEPLSNFYPESDIDDDNSSESHKPNVNEYVYDPETGEVVLKGDDSSGDSSGQTNTNDSQEQQLGGSNGDNENGGSNNGHRVDGDVVEAVDSMKAETASSDSSQVTSSEKNEGDNNPYLIYGIGVVIIIAVIAAAIMIIITDKHGGKKDDF